MFFGKLCKHAVLSWNYSSIPAIHILLMITFQEAAVRKNLGQLRHLSVECCPPPGILDEKPDLGIIRIYTGEKIPAEEKEHQKASYYLVELIQNKVLLIEVEEKLSYDFFVIDNSTSSIFRTLLEGMMKHCEDEYPRGTLKVIEKLLGKKKDLYQSILDKFFTAMKSGDMKGPQYSDTDDEDVETDSE